MGHAAKARESNTRRINNKIALRYEDRVVGEVSTTCYHNIRVRISSPVDGCLFLEMTMNLARDAAPAGSVATVANS
jgi:hypothetical protein